MTTKQIGRTVALLALLVPMLLIGSGSYGSEPSAPVRDPDLRYEDVTFEGDKGLTIGGTVVAPEGEGIRHPAVVLIHGSGTHPRDDEMATAEELARRGIVSLAYDKRAAGYSLLQRDYRQLARDALAAVRMMRERDDVDPAMVGIRGFSEGGWVATYAAARSEDVAFLITLGGNAVPPSQQESWGRADRTRRAGVEGSLLTTSSRTVLRVLVDAGQFPEAHFDPVPLLLQVQQPVLGIWGELERVSPPAEGLLGYERALEHGGNPSYTGRILPGGTHGARTTSDDGLTSDDEFVPGYFDLVADWVLSLQDGPPESSVDPAPDQVTTSTPLEPLAWYESSRLQLAAPILFVVAFLGYPLIGLVRALRRRGAPIGAVAARWTSAAGAVAVLGTFAFLIWLQATGGLTFGPILAGRPLIWIALQLASVGVIVAAAATVLTRWRARRTGAVVSVGERIRFGLLYAGALVFIPWALFWGLLLP